MKPARAKAVAERMNVMITWNGARRRWPFDEYPDGGGSAVVRLVLVLISLVVLCATMAAYSDIDIFQPDAVPYLPVVRPWNWLVHEGRWLNWLLFPVLRAMNGTVVLFLTLAFLFVFAFMAARRYIEDSTYAAVFAALWIQASAWTLQLLWPFVCLAAGAVLVAAAFTVRKLPIYVFYTLFGVLMCGTIQHLYFVLPLLHLPLLAEPTFRANIRVLAMHIVPAWTSGFLFGSMVSLLVVYGATWIENGVGQIGLVVPDWRKPNPVDSLDDLAANTINIFGDLIEHLMLLSLHDTRLAWMVGSIGVLALLLCISRGLRHVPAKLLSMSIIISIYVAYIPFLGNFILFRTGGVIAAVGLAALLFLTRQSVRWRQTAQLGLVVCMSMAWSVQSIRTLDYRIAHTDTYRNELLRAAPREPELFEGIVFMNSGTSINEGTAAFISRLGLSAKGIDVTELSITNSYWLRPSAIEAGFQRFLGCGDRNASHYLCEEVNVRFGDVQTVDGTPLELITVLGEHKGWLVVSINKIWTDSGGEQ